MFPKPEIILQEDQKQMLSALRRYGTCSRNELAARLGINAGVITRLSRELITLGLVRELDREISQGRGRPSQPLCLNGNGAYSIGVTIHAGWADVAVVDFSGAVIKQTSFIHEADDLKLFAKKTAATVSDLLGSLSLFRSRFLGFGLSVPGFAQSDDPSYRHTVAGLGSWRGHDLSLIFADELAGPVWIENDANAAALAEYYSADYSKLSSLMLIYMSHGVGGGFIMNGHIYRGSSFNAGEIGCLYPLSEPRPSALGLLQHLRKGNSSISSLIELRSLQGEISKEIDQWTKRASRQLELAVYTGICWLDPEVVVISGTLPDGITHRILSEIERIDWASRIDDRRQPQFKPSKLGGTAAAIGAAILPIHETISPARPIK